MKKPEPTAAKVINLATKKHAKLVMAAFDVLTHAAKRDTNEQRVAVERAARNKI